MTKQAKWHVHPAKTQINLPRLVRVFAVCMKKLWAFSSPLSTQRGFWSDFTCSVWSVSPLCANVILLVLSCCGSFHYKEKQQHVTCVASKMDEIMFNMSRIVYRWRFPQPVELSARNACILSCTDSYRLLLCLLNISQVKYTNLYAIIELQHDKTSNMTCAPSEDSDQSGHLPNLISLHCPHEETLGS